MTTFADLEVSVHRREAKAYTVEMRYSQPDSEAEQRFAPAEVHLDLDELRSLALDAAAYGQRLSQGLFGAPALRSAFAQVRASAQSLQATLRLRLVIGPSAPELHSVCWETLRDPENGAPLFTDENLLFSRYLSSLDWRPVRLRPRRQLQALAVVANPADLSDYGLASIDVAAELSRLRTSLGDIPLTTLPQGDKAATLDNLLACLRANCNEGGFDILYLAAHGALVDDEPWLWLEDDSGKTARLAGAELAVRLRELQQRPLLVVLASCQSAAPSAGEALTALGPRLAEAGIPAVVAMQGNISIETLEKFMPVFFEQLGRDGQIDRAMAVARRAVQGRPDQWVPALFMRLKSGRVWYVPGFADERESFEKWPALIRSIRRGQCTPILGPGLVEPLLGSQREIAQRWAETYRYPMAPHERESLPQVAQYLCVNQDQRFPYDELEEYLQHEMQNRYGDTLPPNLRHGRPPLDHLTETVGKMWRQDNPLDPHKTLAQLPLPIFITTNLDSLLESALQEAGKDPQAMICPWNEYIEQSETVYDREPDYRPTPDRPLVYHLFGQYSQPDSIVLTEDDYFDFLIGVTSNKDLIPTAVRRALADAALLFLGFQMDEWNFRVLFRSILAQQGGGRRERYAHIAAQIEPEEGRILEPERARRYLEKYFTKGVEISIYWGSAQDFAKELNQRWLANP